MLEGKLRSLPRATVFRTAGAVLIACSVLASCGPDSRSWSATPYRGTLLPEPIEKIDFTLADTRGEPFRFRRETDGYVTLLFFGYTYCPDICPIHMASIATVLRDMPLHVRSNFKIVFVSTDPERDSAERIRDWLDAFDPAFVGLRGSLDEVNRIQTAYGLAPSEKGEVDENGGYLVGHAAQVIAFTGDNLAHLVYPFGTRQSDWAFDLPKLIGKDWNGG